MRTVQRVGVVLVCLLLVAAGGWAQSTTGSIRGTVTDDTGAVLPGASVTISSDALIGGSRTTVTNNVGVYRFPSLSPGTYAVEVAMDGFETKRIENVQVGVNATATVNVALKLATVAETVTVVGESPIVDVTRSSISTSYKNELLEEIPTQRSMTDLIQVAPGMSVDVGDSQSGRVIAFGSNRQSNSWNIDGVDVSGPETGAAWWFVNPDNIEEIEIIGVGAPAEYGNHLGGVFNIVTKKGGNDFHGGGSFFFQHDALTDTNVRLPDSEFTFHREKYVNPTMQLGGPIRRDRMWFFASSEFLRDASTEPGNDPSFTPTNYSDKYDLKVTTQLGDKNELTVFGHLERWGFPQAPTPFFAPSALSGERGRNPAWGASLTTTHSANWLSEIKYAGWWSDDIHDSQTGSFDEPFIDYTPPGGGPTTYSGGVWYPWDYVTWRQQLNGKVTAYTEDFLNSQHEFKFGVQYSEGSAKTNVAVGPTGSYLYNYGGYLYRAVQDPYQYGGRSHDLGVFLDDTVTVSDKLTLNLGVRFDHNTGDFPDYQRLTIGEPSISPAGLFKETGETIPGVDNLIDWNNVSPRLGFAYQPFGDGRTVIRGFFGVHYDQNVIGNWDAPAPGRPTFRLYGQNPVTGEIDQLLFEITPQDIDFNRGLKAPRTLQYFAGWEQQLSNDVSFSLEYVHKDTDNLVGWEILGGAWEQVPFTDPFTGREFTLLSQLEQPTLRKGNDPGDFPGSENLDYFQDYDGVVFSVRKRFTNRWGLQASYTWSRSVGLIPRMLSQVQFNPFYGSKEGSDPNNYINAEGRLQGDRPHMFRLQGVFMLPHDFELSTSMDFSSGRAHNRQIRVGGLGQGTATVIMEPGGSYRYPAVKNIDLLIGKRLYVSDSAYFRLEGWILNLLNSDQVMFYSTLRLQNPGEDFVPDTWVKPRRLMVRIGFYF